MGILVRLLILSSVAALTSSVFLRVMPRSQSSRIFSRRSRPQFSFGAFSSISDADTVNLGGRSLGLQNGFGSSGRGYLMLNGDTPDAFNPYDLGDAPDIYPIISGSSLNSRGLGGYQLMYGKIPIK
ncbi:uncharacterized protein LOC133201008 [Saccostrea echinata]|uniref:uncharacterized protein LOC133201008 n=1 Tax=Saccostrea echinata TaxID=191078 RepID=UPI002A80F47F|nr:uncharacterized protein LOC133201008 [Saccostrea echinata]